MTILNNGLFAKETGNLINNPIFYVPDPEKSGAIAGAKMYFGLVGTDPMLPENQKKVYALQEDKKAFSMPVPVVCSAGGVPQLNGSIVSLAVVGSFSLKILDSNNVVKYFFQNVEQKDNQGFSGVIAQEAKTVAGSQTLVFDGIEASTASFYMSDNTAGTSFKGAFMRPTVDYDIVNSSTIMLLNSISNGTVILGRESDPTGQTIEIASGTVGFFAFPLIADAKDSNLELGATVTINGGTALGDGKGGDKYIVVTGGTGAADDINYINLDNGLQLKLIPNLNTFAAYSENTNVAPISASVSTIDMSLGSVHTVTLTDNISTLNFDNVSQLAGKTITCTLKVTQDGIGGRTIAWPASVNWAGGTPTITATANARDRYVFITDDGGASWDAMTSGQDFS